MPETNSRRLSADEWTKLIEAFLASGLTQKAFSEKHGIRYDRFRHHYQRSPLFRGKRRKPATCDFKPVAVTTSLATASGWAIRVGDLVSIDCPKDLPIDAIVRLIRGLADDA